MLKTILDRMMSVCLIGQLPMLVVALVLQHPVAILGAGACVVGIIASCMIGTLCGVEGYSDGPVAGPLVAALAYGATALIPTVALADPGILPGAQQGSGSGMASLVTLGVIVFGAVVVFAVVPWCLSALGRRSAK